MRIAFAMTALASVAFITGCHNNAVDASAFKSSLNDYYSGHQDCLWSQPIKFPVQADTSDETKTQGFDALTDAGLLNRTPGEKQRFLIGSKQVNNYDLSDKGRSAWVADPAEPGFGNFCVGAPQVNAIDNYAPASSSNTAQYTVTYHYAVALPSWANSSEIKTAFPRIARDSGGQQATATLLKSGNGWQVQNVAPAASSNGE